MPKVSFQAKLAAGFLLSLLIIALVNYFSFKSIKKLEASSALVTHTQEVKTVSSEVLIHILNAETGQRGYVITGNERYLEPYRDAVSSNQNTFRRLSSLIEDNPDQVQRVDTLNQLIQRKLDLM